MFNAAGVKIALVEASSDVSEVSHTLSWIVREELGSLSADTDEGIQVFQLGAVVVASRKTICKDLETKYSLMWSISGYCHDLFANGDGGIQILEVAVAIEAYLETLTQVTCRDSLLGRIECGVRQRLLKRVDGRI